MVRVYLGFRQNHDEVCDFLESISFRNYDHAPGLKRTGRLFAYYEKGMNCQVGLRLRYQGYLDTNFWGRVDKSVRSEAVMFVSESEGTPEKKVQYDIAKSLRYEHGVIVVHNKVIKS